LGISFNQRADPIPITSSPATDKIQVEAAPHNVSIAPAATMIGAKLVGRITP